MKNYNLIKKIILMFFIMISENYAFAESCIMVAPANITKVECKNNNVLRINILSTLYNEKKSAIATSLCDGETSFALYMKHKKCDYKAKVKNGKLEIKGDSTIKVLSIDLPPELKTTEECN